MRTVLFFIMLPLLVVGLFFESRAQSSTSKGTEFWTAYMDHINGVTGNTPSKMALYITSDVSTTGTVDFADKITASIAFTVTQNAVTIVPIPASQFLGSEGQFLKGIHITSLKPIAVYAHIYASSVSGATLLLPVNNLGKDYYSLNYTQISNAVAYSTFAVIATEDQTSVQITPSATLNSGKAANATFTVVLNKGELYQGLSNTDLTGTRIKSVSTASGGCKKIAVFSGSSKIGIGCSAPGALSSDNLFQQVYPTSAWGKNYITVALKNRFYDVFRIFLSDPATKVTLNGNPIAASSFTNSYYEFNTNTTNSATNVISADKPIQVVQYTPTQGQTLLANCQTKNDTGDPEMIYLAPVEQGLDHVTLYSTGYYNILQSYINVVIPTSAVSTFMLDGAPYTSFTPVANNIAYSYAQINVTSGPNDPATGKPSVPLTAGTHNISASAPFNAIAYGFGGTESYGYAAGTNLLDLNENIKLSNTQTQTALNSGCTGATYKFQMTLPFQTTQIVWDFKDGTAPVTVNNPPLVKSYTAGTQTLYVYEYATPVTYPTAGSFSVVASIFNPVADDCGSYQTLEFDFTITDPPGASFTAPGPACLGSPSTFTDTSDPKGSTIKTWLWDFGDGQTGNTANPSHTYAKTGDYPVQLTVTNENGCTTTSAVQTVHVTALPVASFTYSTTTCETQAITFTDASTATEGTIAKWAWDFGDGQTANIASPNHTYAKAGAYTVKLTVTTAAGCISATYQVSVTINPMPSVDFALPAACLVNSIAQFNDKSTITGNTGTPFTYLWDFGDANATAANPNTATIANPTHQFTAAGVYHIKLMVTSKLGCSFSKVQDYTVSGQAKFNAQPGACPNDLVTFTDQTDPTGKIANAWHWDFGDGAVADVQNPLHPFTKPGDYIVTLTVTGNNGCSTTSFNQSIHISALPVSSFTLSTPDCETQAITFTDASTPGEGTLSTWAWDFGDGQTANTASPSHTYAKAGAYTVKLTVTNSNGCISATGTQQLTVHAMPQVDFALPTVCLAGATAQFTDKTTLGVQPYTYAWDFGDANATAANPNTAAIANPTHLFSAGGVYQVKLTVTTADGCTIYAKEHDYTVSGQAKFSAQANACRNDQIIFTDQTDPSGKATTAWHWDFGNGDVADVQNPKYAYAQAGDYIVTLTVTGNSGCSTTTSRPQNVHIYKSPVASFTASTPDCETRSITFTDASNASEGSIASWAWDFGDGQTANTASPTHSFATAGTYQVSLTITTSNGCISAANIQQVTVSPLPVVNFTTPDVCLADAFAQFTDNSTIADHTESSFTYLWNFGDANANAANPNTSTLANPKHKYTQIRDKTNPYSVTLTVTSKYGCSVTLSQPFTVNGDTPFAQFKIDPVNTFCSSDDVLFDDNSTVNFGEVTKIGMIYDWANHPKDTVYYKKGEVLKHNYGLFNNPVKQNFQVRMVAYSGGSCSNFSSIQTVTIYNNPTVTVPRLGSVCQNSGTHQITADPGPFTGTGVFSGKGISASGLFDPQAAGPGTFTINYVFTATNGCTYIDPPQQIIVYPSPTANAGPDLHLLQGGTITINATASANVSYKWTLASGGKATGLDHDDVLTPVANPTDDTKYMLTVTTPDGCTATSTVTVYVLKAPVIPNTFTPNNDSYNDTWDIKYLDTYPNATVEIFNRYGDKVYSSIGYPVAWDGKYKGADLPVGTYYYIINPKNGRKVISGSVTIIR